MGRTFLFRTVDGALKLERLKVDPAIEIGQPEMLAALCTNRNSAKVSELLSQLENVALGTLNPIPPFIERVGNNITLGEIYNTLRVAWGEYVAEGF